MCAPGGSELAVGGGRFWLVVAWNEFDTGVSVGTPVLPGCKYLAIQEE